jgi:FkbM family methyltransferase
MPGAPELYVPHLGWLRHEPGDEVARFLAEGWFEYREQAFWRLYLREGDTVIDAGAHFGLYSALAASLLGRNGRVLAVEPNAETAKFLIRNLEKYGGECVQASVGAEDGHAEYFPGAAGRGAYGGSVAEKAGTPPRRVRRVTMDTLLREAGVERTALVKIDVEGDEVEALRGARAAIAAGALPLLMVEFAEKNLDRRGLTTRVLHDELMALGYTVCRFDPDTRSLAPASWNGPVWYENYFAAISPVDVNRRLAACSAKQSRLAADILSRGRAAAELRADALEARRRGDEAREREAERNEERRRAGDLAGRLEHAEKAAEEAGRRAAEASAHLEESWRRISEANWRADQAAIRADDSVRRVADARAQLEESWRRIGEANWRADQAAIRAENAGGRAEAAYRRLEAADRRAVNARYEADLLKSRLRDLLLHPDLPHPDWAEKFLSATEDLAAPAASSDQADPEQRALYHLAGKNFQPGTVLDVGAARAYWSLNAQSYFPDAQFYLAEPLDEYAGELRDLCARDSRFHFLPTAIGAGDGPVEITVSADLFGSHCLPHPEADPARRRTVRQRTVDSLIAEGCLAPPDLVKIDVQGYEIQVIAGAAEALKRAEAVMVEVSLFRFMPDAPLAHEVIADLASRGFVLFDVAGSLRRPYEDDLGQLDLVFVSSRSRLVESSRWD